jgi:hypothetical protein
MRDSASYRKKLIEVALPQEAINAASLNIFIMLRLLWATVSAGIYTRHIELQS